MAGKTLNIKVCSPHKHRSGLKGKWHNLPLLIQFIVIHHPVQGNIEIIEKS
jgi:hypothetical protein